MSRASAATPNTMEHTAALTKIAPFFGLVLALSLPFWVWGAFGDQMFPSLPVSGLMAFCPAAAALALTWRRGRGAALARFLRDAFDLRRLSGRWRWLTFSLVLPPALLALMYALMRFTGAPLPAPHIDFALVPAMMIAFLVAGLGEELGWFGYAYAPLEEKLGAISAAFAIGVFWAAWHVIPYFQTGREAEWVLWHLLATIALRVLAVWLFLHTGRSVLAAACFHAMCNVSYFSFPNGGSHYDAAYFLPFIGAAAALIVVLWRPRALTS